MIFISTLKCVTIKVLTYLMISMSPCLLVCYAFTYGRTSRENMKQLHKTNGLVPNKIQDSF